MIVAAMLLLSGQATPPAKQNDDQRVKCHVEEETGSLVGHKRVCHTAAQWRQQSDDAQEATRNIQDHGAIQPSHGG